MPAQLIRLHRDAPPKPPASTPCNGCGVCCAAETCPPARLLFRQVTEACPALEWVAESRHYRCGLIVAPGRFLGFLPHAWEWIAARLFTRWVAAGKGCDSDASVEP